MNDPRIDDCLRAVRELRNEVAEVARRVDAIDRTLAERDVEQMSLEGAVEHLADRDRTYLWTLGLVVKALWGDGKGGFGATTLDMLYDGPRHEHGFRQGRFTTWRRPARRWAQFGSRSELLARASAVGAAVKGDKTRESIVRALWKVGELPGAA